MIGENRIMNLVQENNSKILLLVMDGVGDIPDESGMTALEAAKTPNMDKLAAVSNLGLTIAVNPGITPGSGPSHLSLFGYDPIKHEIGRGVLEALGINLHLTDSDLSARANFATRSDDGIILDRRAGRIPTEENERIVAKLRENIDMIGDVKVSVYPGKEHRFVAVFNGSGLNDKLLDADPEMTGVPEKFVEVLDNNSVKSMETANSLIKKVQEILKDEEKANTCLLRGISKVPPIKKFDELYKLKACAIASYPMYKGLSRLVGMDVIEGLSTLDEQVEKLKEVYNDYDFFYFHVKKTDSYGEDGNRGAKVKVIEEFDGLLPAILDLGAEVVCITSDHSTPTPMSGHSWHPNPLLINGPYMRKDPAISFTEPECLKGAYGTFYAVDVMQLLLSQAGRLKKFGA